MGPTPINAMAVEWQFRCRRTQAHDHAWEWRCRSGDGAVVSTSMRSFDSLDEAIADAGRHGFICPPRSPSNENQGS
jgi:hypothetical protein